MQVSKGGSVMMRREEGSDSDFHVSKGGSMLLGPKAEEEWEPGQAITRPPKVTRSMAYDLPIDNGVLRLKFAYRSLQGRNPHPPHKPNQDSLAVECSVGGRSPLAMFGVFDGHGPYGEHASVSALE